ncbi:MAG: PilN domain-containing protein [Polyangiaceae bacterium]
MIRVNLLPQKKKPERGKGASTLTPSTGGQKWLLIPLFLVVAEVVGLLLYHFDKSSTIEDQRKKNQELSGRISEIQAIVTQHDAVKKDLAELTAREDAITQLQAGRTGPTAVLLELAQILTLQKGPTVDPDILKDLQKKNPLQVFNANWDSHRLWLTKYVELARTVRIEGYAKDSADVSELSNRLKTSTYFYGFKLLPGKKEEAQEGLVSFGVELRVRY